MQKKLNADGVLIPSDYRAQQLGIPNQHKNTFHYWSHNAVRNILSNPIYIGHLAQQKFTTVSFKNHKSVRRDKDEWVIAKNTHEPIISQELWDKCQEVDRCASHGKIMKKGIVLPLNSMMFCSDCGAKMKLNGHTKKQMARLITSMSAEHIPDVVRELVPHTTSARSRLRKSFLLIFRKRQDM